MKMRGHGSGWVICNQNFWYFIFSFASHYLKNIHL